MTCMRKIYKPIFIVGMPRSGTSMFFQRMVLHEDLAWTSKTSQKFPRSVQLTRLVSLFHKDRRPTEASRMWKKYGRKEDDCLFASDVTEDARSFYRQVIEAQQQVFNKPRFICKHPRNLLRMGYYQEIFPDAVFIHFIRDGRAVANSLLRCRERHGVDKYWGIKPRNWRKIVVDDPLVACGLQWVMAVQDGRQMAQNLKKGSYMEVRYEDFTKSPEDVIDKVFSHCDLSSEKNLIAKMVDGLEDRNYKWRESFDNDRIKKLNDAIQESLVELGYELSD